MNEELVPVFFKHDAESEKMLKAVLEAKQTTKSAFFRTVVRQAYDYIIAHPEVNSELKPHTVSRIIRQTPKV